MKTIEQLQKEIEEKKAELAEKEHKLENFDSECGDSETDDAYEFVLNEIYGEVSVCGFKYAPGRLLKEIDPTAFQCGKNDWFSEAENLKCLPGYDDLEIEINDLQSEIEDLEAEIEELENEEEEEEND